MRGFYVAKNPLVKPSLSINKRFSTIEESTIEGLQCTNKWPLVKQIALYAYNSV